MKYGYILTNKNKTVLYIGVTSNLEVRIAQHKSKTFGGFTAKYNVDRLIYFEEFQSIEEAIEREKQLKGKTRKKKELLINTFNPQWDEIEV